MEDEFGLLESAVEVEQLEDSGVKYGVHLDALILQHAFLHVFSSVEILVFHTGFEEGSIGEFVHFYLALHHLHVEDLHALLQVALLSLCFDQDAESDVVRLHFFRKHLLIHLQSGVNVSVSDAHVHYAVVQNAVHCSILCLQSVQPSEHLTVSFIFWQKSGLLLHPFDHSAVRVLISDEGTCCHFVEEALGQFKLVEVN